MSYKTKIISANNEMYLVELIIDKDDPNYEFIEENDLLLHPIVAWMVTIDEGGYSVAEPITVINTRYSTAAILMPNGRVHHGEDKQFNTLEEYASWKIRTTRIRAEYGAKNKG